MSRIVHRVDAFADGRHKGNPGGVYLLQEDLSLAELQDIALRAGLPVTTFLRQTAGNQYDIRWFTMNMEVQLCGHGTMAATYWLFNEYGIREMSYQSVSGPLKACITENDMVEMDFPAQQTKLSDAAGKAAVEEALGISVKSCYFGFEDYLVELESSRAVAEFEPDFEKIAKVDCRGIIITAWDEEYGYNCVSRFFCPRVAIDEDQVCVSAHCKIVPYWEGQKGVNYLHAWQASPNSGELRLYAQANHRVKIQGSARVGEAVIID